jgi:hypothetical protein
MFLARSIPFGGTRVVVPSVLLTQPVGETIIASIPADDWYLSISTTIQGFRIGDTVEHSMLPGNEVAVQSGNTAIVTGSLKEGFSISVNYY